MNEKKNGFTEEEQMNRNDGLKEKRTKEGDINLKNECERRENRPKEKVKKNWIKIKGMKEEKIDWRKQTEWK